MLRYGPLSVPCALGRSGCRVRKREGDGATPVGCFAVRRVLYRADRLLRPRTRLPVAVIGVRAGWCDSPGDRNYNRQVTLPYAGRAERLWRSDRLYDLVVVLGYNDTPRRHGSGSAIFLHVAHPVAPRALAPTEGCIAVPAAHLLRLLARLAPGARVSIR
jgi:L,D-peptidoglycan transpeptidase YkuD (ErfK/YbiS/YcfS/YnhG family)